MKRSTTSMVGANKIPRKNAMGSRRNGPASSCPLYPGLCCKTRPGSIAGLRFEFWPSFGSGGIDALRAAYRDQLAIARVGGAR
jgi:hypothetical protein